MTTNSAASLSRPTLRLLLAIVGAAALPTTFACAAPAEQGPEPTENASTQSEALANTGGGGTSTCDSRWQNCYFSCGALYGLKHPQTQGQCEALCDEIHTDCSGVTRSPIRPRPIPVSPPVRVGH